MTAPPEPVLSVRELCVDFGGHRAVDGVSFDLHPRETLALVGESGSGKSATALAILRLVEREGGRISGGCVRLGGAAPADLTALPEAALRRIRGNRIAMVFQEPMTSLNPVMRVGDQVLEAVTRHRRLDRPAAARAAEEALAAAQVPEPARRMRQFPHELSGGLRQRVMIAMALACRPDVLIADEPTTALDVTTQAEILDLLARLQAQFGMAVLFITHDMGVVARMADRVLVLRHGRAVEDGPVRGVFARPRAPYTRELMAAAPRLGSGGPAPAAAGAPAPLLEVEGLVTAFPGPRRLFRRGVPFRAVDGVSLSVGRGETLGLVGESGCGKSTLARSILGLVPVSAGRVRLDGAELTGLTRAAMRPHRAKVQMVFQDPMASLNPRMRVRDLVTEPARLHGRVTARGARDMAALLLEKVGLEADAADRYPHQFSGGQRQRICIARALSVSPRLIVADEAVSALDVSIARRITDLMLRLQREDGVSFLFISHDIAVVERVSHRIAVMRAGKVVETGPTTEVLRAPRHPYTRALLASVPVPDPEARWRGTGGDRAPAAPADMVHTGAA